MNKNLLLLLAAHLGGILLLALGKMNYIPNGVFATPDMLQVEYVVSIVCIAQTVAAVLAAYYMPRRPVLRMLLVSLVVLLDIAFYYLTLRTSNLLCAAIAYLSLWYCYATTQRHHRQL